MLSRNEKIQYNFLDYICTYRYYTYNTLKTYQMTNKIIAALTTLMIFFFY